MKIAQKIILNALSSGEGVLSTQVLQEFFNITTKKRIPLTEYQRFLELDKSHDWGDLFQETMAMIDRDTADKEVPAADDLIHQMRRERDAELLSLP